MSNNEGEKEVTMAEYGIRWQEFNRADQLVTKEKFFASQSALLRFMKKQEEKNNFYEWGASWTRL